MLERVGSRLLEVVPVGTGHLNVEGLQQGVSAVRLRDPWRLRGGRRKQMHPSHGWRGPEPFREPVKMPQDSSGFEYLAGREHRPQRTFHSYFFIHPTLNLYDRAAMFPPNEQAAC